MIQATPCPRNEEEGNGTFCHSVTFLGVIMEKLMEALAKITLGGALTFFFFYSVVITIALIVFISRSNDTPEQIQRVEQINKLIDAQGGK